MGLVAPALRSDSSGLLIPLRVRNYRSSGLVQLPFSLAGEACPSRSN